MPRDYRKLLRSEGVVVPRWVIVLLVGGGLVWVALRILVPPSWIVQRLDSPDGKRSAKLLRTQYVRQSLVVHVRDGMLWHTAFYSDSITNDYRQDLGERLVWSKDASTLCLRAGGRLIWGYDFARGKDLSPQELAAGVPGGSPP